MSNLRLPIFVCFSTCLLSELKRRSSSFLLNLFSFSSRKSICSCAMMAEDREFMTAAVAAFDNSIDERVAFGSEAFLAWSVIILVIISCILSKLMVLTGLLSIVMFID